MSPSDTLSYMLIEKTPQNELFLNDTLFTIPLDQVLRNILTRCIILMLKDQFCDYEDINVLTPVRSQAMGVIQRISELAQKG